MFQLNSGCTPALKKSCRAMIFAKLLSNSILIVYTITIKNMINTVVLSDVKKLIPYLVLFVSAFIGIIISNRFILRLERRLLFSRGRELREEFLSGLNEIKPCCKDRHDRMDLSHRFMDEIDKIVEFYITTVPGMVKDFTFFIFFGIYAVVQNAWLIFILIFVTVIVYFLSVRNKKQIHELNAKIVPCDVERNTIEYDVVAANMELNFFKANDYIDQKVLDAETQYIENSIKLQNKHRFFWGMEIFTFIGMKALFYTVGAIFAMQGSLTFGAITSFVVLLDSINSSVFLFPNIMFHLSGIKPSIERYNAWMKEERGKAAPSGGIRPESERVYTLEHFGYGYRGKKERVLTDINLRIERGKKYFVTGQSGCGKSTLLKMLMGYDDLYSGKLQYKDSELSDLPADCLSRDIHYMSDDMFLISGTIREIFRLFYPALQDEAILRLLDLVELPFSLETEIEKDGGNISGGEKQRLLLALSLAEEKSVYLMDECLSMVSLEQQLRIMKRIFRNDMTCLWIDHRVLPEVLAFFDEILFLENATLYRGTPETMRGNDSFCRLLEKGVHHVS